MLEKLSEEDIRIKKIDELKNKIKTEIDEITKIIKVDDDDYHHISFYLNILHNHILEGSDRNGAAFMQWEYYDTQKDIIQYTIPIGTINMWLQDDYNFTRRFIYNIAQNPNARLSDEFFVNNMLTAVEEIIYEKRMKE